MKLEILAQEFAVCALPDFSQVDGSAPFCFASKTDREFSLVCTPEAIPANALRVQRGWRAFRVAGQLDFSLIGILAGITDVLARARVGVFVVSTFDTDYVLTAQADFDRALAALAQSGYEIKAQA